MLLTPRERRADERDNQRNLVNDICRNMKPVRTSNPAATRTVWNECLQRYVEVR